VLAGVAVMLLAAVGKAMIAGGGEGSQAPNATPVARRLPRLVDVGAGRCIPCKAMAPILEGLKAEYAGRMDVDFIDVWKNPAAAKPFAIRLIPTQIFLDSDGRELARHQGFMSRDAILAQWKALGVEF
jgi:thioredoxin 1